MTTYVIFVEGDDAADREEIEHKLTEMTEKTSALSNECAASWDKHEVCFNWDVIEDILDSIKLAETTGDNEVWATVQDYVVNRYGD